MRTIAAVVIALSLIVPALAAAPPQEAVAGAEAQIAAKEYEPSRHGDLWMAPNRAQGFRVTFDGDGILLMPRSDEKKWTWGLRFAGVGRNVIVASEPGTVRVAGARVTYDRGKVVEWFENRERGLEHGFTLEAPPAGDRGQVTIALERSGSLTPVPDRDGLSIDLMGTGGRPELSYADLAVRDAVGRELPAHMEARSRMTIVFDDTGATYPVTVDPAYKNPATTLQSFQNASWFGYSVSTAGDVNGDGYSDVIVGAPLYDNGQDAEGRAFLYLGGPNGLSTTPAWTTESDVAQANLGWVVAPAGDVNGDGYADVIVTQPGWNNGAGQVWVFYGNASGLSATVSWFKLGSQPFGAFGSSAATAGDVNGDGYSDIIVGAPSESDGQSLEGKAYVFMGSASGLATTTSWIEESNQANANFGASVASAGDVNGDGYDDIIVSADQYDDPELNEGRVWVYLGGPNGLGLLYQFTADGNQAGANFGASVAGAGDVNGDGYADIIIGAPGYDNPENAEGKAFVYYGGASGVGGPPQWTFESNLADAHLGNAVGTAGDINGDGYADVVVGASQFTNGGGVNGRVLVFTGSLFGLSSTPAFQQDGAVNERLGISVGTAGDVDGDGFSDIVIGGEAPLIDGRAYVYRFMADTPLNSPQWTIQGDVFGGRFGLSVASADVNGDGFSDILVGQPGWDGFTLQGKAYLYLGGTGGLASTPVWTVTGPVTGGQFGWSLDSAGDVNGDGYTDVVVGAPSGTSGGSVSVYYGGPAGLPASPSWTAQSPHSGSVGFGRSVTSAGDVNGDGFSDLIVGAPGDGDGVAYVYLGSATGLSPTPSWTAHGGSAQSGFGQSVASAGDVNRDGYSDVIVGEPGYSNGQTSEGRASLYLGSAAGLSPTPVWTKESNQASGEFGWNVSSAGDVNGDGYADVLVSLFGVASPSSLWLGGPSGLTEGPGGFVTAVGAAGGDVDNDGYGDVIVGNEIWRGSSSGTLTQWKVLAPPQPNFNQGRCCASAGDVNGDGYPDFIYGSDTYGGSQRGAAFFYMGNGLPVVPYSRVRGPQQFRSNGATPIGLYGKSDTSSGFRITANGLSAAGRTRLRFIWEVKPLGTPFNGMGLGSSTLTDTGTPVSQVGSVAHFTPAVVGLSSGTAYHWRTRTVSTNPYFPQAPWMSSVGNSQTETKLRTPGCHDLDGDGHGAPSDGTCALPAPDCDDSNPSVWARPGETLNLRFTTKTTLVWDPPTDLGAASAFYDTLRATSPTGFGSAFCVETNDALDFTAFDTGTPLVGQVFYYLTRAENLCPVVGLGSLGNDSNGNERTGRNCP